MAETLLCHAAHEGYPVRLSATRSAHVFPSHAAWQPEPKEWHEGCISRSHRADQADFVVIDSLLSEEAALGLNTMPRRT